MRRSRLVTLGLLLVLLLPGCFAAQYEYTSNPAVSSLETKDFSVSVTPEKGDNPYFPRFRLEVENRSSRAITIDWNKTRYLVDGKNRGGFVWGGIDPAALKSNTVPEEKIAPGQVFSKQISPLAKVAMAGRKEYTEGKDGLYGGMLPAGENGILLTLKVNGQLVRKKITMIITESRN